jgi:methylmalonyl-CoA mutase
MPDESQRSSPLVLRDDFPRVSTAAWEEAIRTDLGDADAARLLTWHTGEGIALRAFYRAADLSGLDAQTSAAPGVFPFVRGSGEAPVTNGLDDLPADAIRADLHHDAGATAVQELGFALAEGIERLAASSGDPSGFADRASSLPFVFAVGPLFFIEIAKLRAARLAWAQIVAAVGARAEVARMRLLVRTARSDKSLVDPFVNLLRTTTESLSAVIGGCDRLVIEPVGGVGAKGAYINPHQPPEYKPPPRGRTGGGAE